MEPIYFVEGQFMPASAAKIPIDDLGVLRGLAVFDYLRTYRGRPFHLWDHLLRLQFSAREVGITLPYSLQQIADIVLELLQRNNFAEAGVKIVVTGGESADQISFQEKARMAILSYPLPPLNATPISVITTPRLRVVPWAKTTIYTSAILALAEAKKRAAQDALYLNAKGEILEATTSNFFAVRKGVAITPFSEELLLGITRGVVLKLMPVEERSIACDEPLDEAFLTSSTREIVPITAIDGRPLKVGPITKELMTRFRAYADQGQWEDLSISRHLTPSAS